MVAMPAPGERLRLMAVHAHPDDESSKGAATMARYVREGIDVLVVTCTGGERGSILNPAMDRPEVVANLPAVRREEMRVATNILGVRNEWLGFEDSGFPEGDPPPPPEPGSFADLPLAQAAAPLVELVRRERPHVIITYDEQGGYPHPDHIRVHEISVEAFEAAPDPERYPGEAEPWQPLKMYYVLGWNKPKLQAIHEALLGRGLESPYTEWLEKWEDKDEDRDRLTTHVECAEYFELRNQALIAHATQVDPEGSWFAVPLDLQQAVWPREDFQLARSLVDTTLPEDDLFAGIREPSQRSG
jgi:mycothiol S-conjugate amidase